MLKRHAANPLISPKDVQPSRPDWSVIGTFNAGACTYNDEILLLLRVAEKPISTDENMILCPYFVDGELVIDRVRRDDPDWFTDDPRLVQHRKTGLLRLTSISHLRLARSTDGVNFTVEAAPWLSAADPFEAYGIEDGRITRIGDTYYVNYTAVSTYGVATSLVSTTDFVSIERHGIIFPPSNRDVTIFPQQVNGKYVCYHRPMPQFGGLHMWYADSPDLKRWGNHKPIVTSSHVDWMSARVGGGAPPILTDAGWLSIYHAADTEDRYCLGAFITDKDDPSKLVAIDPEPIFVPEASYETEGFFSQVVFTCGVVEREGQLLVYYGTSDEHTALATIGVDELVSHLMKD